MAPTVTRELSVVYGSTTVGGTNDVHLDGPVRLTMNSRTATVSFTAAVLGSATVAAFKTSCAALETAFTTRHQALTVTLDGQTMSSFSHALNTGYNAEPNIRKLDEGSSARSRKYEITVTLELPALSADNYLRNATMDLEVDRFDVKRVTFTGAYTADSGTPATARVTHDAQVSSFCETQLDLIDNGVTWILLERQSEATDHTDKNIEWRRVYVDRLPVFGSFVTSPAKLKRATITGTYKDAGSGARAVYTANVATDASTELTAIDSGATWELIEERTEVDDGDTFIIWTRVYDELNANQSSGTLDDSDIVNASLTVDSVADRPGDADTGAERMTMLLVNYSAWIDADQSTDLTGKWTTKIKPWLASHVQTISGATQLALIRNAPRFDSEENRITATQVWVAVGGSKTVRSTIQVRDQVASGTTYIPVWSGDPYDVDPVPGPIVHIRDVLEERDEVGAYSTASIHGLRPTGESPTPNRSFDAGQGFVVLFETVDKTPRRIGLQGDQIDVVTTTRLQRMRKIRGGTGGTGNIVEGSVTSVARE